jgi:NADH-quinone oxidoreductase subunit G
LRSARSVCVGCATGCSSFTDFDPRVQKVYRYRPRENLAVNKYWMCDDGMLDYRRIHEKRVLTAHVRGEETSADTALEKAVELLQGAPADKTAVLLSAEHSLEDNYALLALARDVLKTQNVYFTGRPPGQADEILRHPDKNPNTAGVKLLAPGVRSFSDLSAAIGAGNVTHLLALGSQIPDSDKASSLKGLKNFVALTTHEGPLARYARVLLPASSWAEADGTFVNAKGMAQESEKVITAQGDSRPAWRWLADLSRELGHVPAWRKLAELRAAFQPQSSPATPGAGTAAGAS